MTCASSVQGSEAPAPSGGILRRLSLHLQCGPTRWRRVRPGPKTQVRFTLTTLKKEISGTDNHCGRNHPKGGFQLPVVVYTLLIFYLFKSVVQLLSLCPFSCRLFDSGEEQAEQSEEDKPECVSPQPVSQSYAATVALPSTPPSSATLLGTAALSHKRSK